MSPVVCLHLDEEITLEESAAAEAFLMGSIATFQAQYADYKLGLVDENEWQQTRKSMAMYFTTSWPRAWLETVGDALDSEFAELVGDLIKENGISGSHFPLVLERAKEIRRGTGNRGRG